MKQYHIIIARPALTPEIKALGPTAGEAFRAQTHRDNLMMLAKRIELEVLTIHGGSIVDNGSEFGRGSSNDMICVETTGAGVEALKKIPEINRISERIDLDKLAPAKGLATNVPLGLSWNRPQP